MTKYILHYSPDLKAALPKIVEVFEDELFDVYLDAIEDFDNDQDIMLVDRVEHQSIEILMFVIKRISRIEIGNQKTTHTHYDPILIRGKSVASTLYLLKTIRQNFLEANGEFVAGLKKNDDSFPTIHDIGKRYFGN